MPIGDILMAGIKEPLLLFIFSQIKLHAIGVYPPADSLTKFLPANINLTGLHHLVSAKTIQVRECNFTNQLIEGFLRRKPTSLDMSEMIENIPSSRLFLFA